MKAAAVVPGVALDGGAAQLEADPGDKAEEGFLDGDDQGENEESEPGGRMMGDMEFADALHGDESPGGKERECDDHGGDGLGFAVAVGMVVVGGGGWRF